MKYIAIILAGGSGRRMGSTLPKQFLKVNGKTVIEYTIDTFEQSADIDEIAIVTHPDYVEDMNQIIASNSWKKVSRILLGGKNELIQRYQRYVLIQIMMTDF